MLLVEKEVEEEEKKKKGVFTHVVSEQQTAPTTNRKASTPYRQRPLVVLEAHLHGGDVAPGAGLVRFLLDDAGEGLCLCCRGGRNGVRRRMGRRVR